MSVSESRNEVLMLIGRSAGVRFLNKEYRDCLYATFVVGADGRYLGVLDGLHSYANFAASSTQDDSEENAILSISKAGTAIIDGSWPGGDMIVVWTSPGFSSLEELRMKLELKGRG